MVAEPDLTPTADKVPVPIRERVAFGIVGFVLIALVIGGILVTTSRWHKGEPHAQVVLTWERIWPAVLMAFTMSLMPFGILLMVLANIGFRKIERSPTRSLLKRASLIYLGLSSLITLIILSGPLLAVALGKDEKFASNTTQVAMTLLIGSTLVTKKMIGKTRDLLGSKGLKSLVKRN